MRLTQALLALTLCFTTSSPSICLAQERCAFPQPTTDPKFKPGQVWNYTTRAGEEQSTLTILRVETTPKLGTIVHVRIDGIHFRNCTGGPAPTMIEHMPFARETLDASVVKQINNRSVLPDYEAGYRDWLSHCGGVYTIPIDQVIALDDAQFGKSLGCQ